MVDLDPHTPNAPHHRFGSYASTSTTHYTNSVFGDSGALPERAPRPERAALVEVGVKHAKRRGRRRRFGAAAEVVGRPRHDRFPELTRSIRATADQFA